MIIWSAKNSARLFNGFNRAGRRAVGMFDAESIAGTNMRGIYTFNNWLLLMPV